LPCCCYARHEKAIMVGYEVIIYYVFLACLNLYSANNLTNLDYRISTVENLGLNLASPVIYHDFIFDKSCVERCIAVIDVVSYQVIRFINLYLAPLSRVGFLLR